MVKEEVEKGPGRPEGLLALQEDQRARGEILVGKLRLRAFHCPALGKRVCLSLDICHLRCSQPYCCQSPPLPAGRAVCFFTHSQPPMALGLGIFMSDHLHL